MCLAVPAEVIKINDSSGIVDFGGIYKEVNLSLVPGVKVGDFVLVHAGCAIETYNKVEAEKTLSYLEDILND